MRFNFKKISALATSTLLVGMTVGVAAAASYPNPFVSGGSANVGIVYGTGEGVSLLDVAEAGNIQGDLQAYMAGGGSGSGSSVSGEAVSLASGSDEIYLNDDLAEYKTTLTKDHLPTVLADSTFTNNDGTDYDFEQTISVGTSTSNGFAFSDSDGDLDDPALLLKLTSSPSSTPAYNWTATFSNTVNFTATASKGEEITLFGKTYSVGTSTDSDTLVLLGGSDGTTVNVGETVTLDVDGESYEVTLTGISSSDTSPEAGITVNGESKTFTEGDTKTIGGVDVYVKTVFKTGDNAGYVELQLGADKLTLETGSAVMYGSDNDEYEGTYVTWTGGPTQMSDLTIAVSAADDDENHFLVGESFVDPVFGTVKIEFANIVNGPSFEAEEDTGRTKLALEGSGDREITLELTQEGSTATNVPFMYNNELQDDKSKAIHVVEGETMTEEDYVILNSGDKQHFMQITKINVDQGVNSDVRLKDIVTGESYDFDNHNFNGGGYSATISGQTYTITNTSTTAITITSSDYSTNKAVFPYIELVSGEDYPRVALTDEVAIGDTVGPTVNNDSYVEGIVYELPTGNIEFKVADSANNSAAAAEITVQYRVDESSGTWTTISGFDEDGDTSNSSIAVNEGIYVFDLSLVAHDTNDVNLTIDKVGFDTGLDTTDATDIQTSPGLLFVEDEDRSETTSDVRNVVFFNMTDDGSSYGQLKNIGFSQSSGDQYDTGNWDDSKLTGYLTNWGTYVLKDTSDSDQTLARMTYPDAQMYAEVYFAEESATITPGSTGGSSTPLGEVIYMDTESSMYGSKNLIVVGGSCINSAAASLVGGAYCGSAWTETTNVGSGEFIIKGYTDSTITTKLALLVAGYNAADTVNAAKYLRNKKPDTSKHYIGTTSTSAEEVVETA